MSDIRANLRDWLEFARELGIDSLAVRLPEPAPRRSAARPVAARPASGQARPAPAPTAAPAATGGPRDGAAVAGAAFERIRARIAGGAAGESRPAAPRPTRAPATASPAPTPLARMGAVPDDMTAAAAGAGVRRGETLDEVREILGECERCKLHAGRTKIVFGSGNPNAELMFVGEGPGADEDRQGKPFVGRAGQLLTDIIKAIGMTRDEVYIANVVKCRPPDNRDPEPDEIAACRAFLYQQLAVVRPKLVVALGKPAAETLLGRSVPITRERGRQFDLFGAKLIPTFHPAYLLRNPASKREVWEDMKLVRDLLAASREGAD